MKKRWLLLYIFILLIGCEENVVPKSIMLKMAQKVDPKVQVIIPENLNAGIKCSMYGEGCQGAFQAQVQMVNLVLVEYENTKQAKAAALKFDQWYYKNWLFDEVTSEPVLENFITKVYGAKRARKEIKK